LENITLLEWLNMQKNHFCCLWKNLFSYFLLSKNYASHSFYIVDSAGNKILNLKSSQYFLLIVNFRMANHTFKMLHLEK